MKKLIIIILVIALILFGIKYYNLDNELMKKIYVKNYSNYVEKYSKENDLDENLVYAIIKAESNFKEGAVSSSGAVGLMQLMETTADDVARKMNIDFKIDLLYQAEDNIKIGTKYYKTLYDKYKNNAVALMAYNAGSGNVDRWIQEGTIKSDGTDAENIPYKETNNYVRKILRDYEIYKKLYAKQEGN